MTGPVLKSLMSCLEVCLVNGTRVCEKGLIVSVKPLTGEVIRFLQTDSDFAREQLRMSKDERKSCYYLVFFARDNQKREALCFLELKGKDFDHEVEQVLNTYKYIYAL